MTSAPRCPACGAFVQSSDAFCWTCGTQLREAPPAASQRPQPEAAPAELDPGVALDLRRAHLAQQRGQLEEAERIVTSVLPRHPECVPALSMLATILRARGDLVGSVAAAQRVTELAAESTPLPGAVARAREDRAQIEEQAVREIAGPLTRFDSPLSVFTAPARDLCRSPGLYIALVVVGAVALFLALVAVLRGQVSGYLWCAVSLAAAGWCYHDAETRGLPGLIWGPFVLCLGPFGLVIYFLATY